MKDGGKMIKDKHGANYPSLKRAHKSDCVNFVLICVCSPVLHIH